MDVRSNQLGFFGGGEQEALRNWVNDCEGFELCVDDEEEEDEDE